MRVKDGTVRNHGPRGKLCPGSHKPPLPESAQLRQSIPATVATIPAASEDISPSRKLSSAPVSISLYSYWRRCETSSTE